MAPASFTVAQQNKLKDLAAECVDSGRTPTMTLMRLAGEWDMAYVELAREYVTYSIRPSQPMRSQHQPRTGGPLSPPTPNVHVMRPPVSTSPVADVRAAEGAFVKLGWNWVLIDARVRSDLSPQEVARSLNPPVSSTTYRQIEEGNYLPSADHIAQLAALLNFQPDKAFVMAGSDAPSAEAGRRRQFVKGHSLIGVLRVRQRQTMKGLLELIEAQTKVKIPMAWLSKLERGERQQGVAKELLDTYEKAIASYFAIPVELVYRRVPGGVVQTYSILVSHLHGIIKEEAAQLPAADDMAKFLESGEPKK